MFIITLGLSEIWYYDETGEVFWSAVPRDLFDPKQHKFRVLSTSETKEDLYKISNLIWEYNSNAKILFTISPVPLAATFRPNSCITSNSASKAILVASLDEFLRERAANLNTNLFYFPSYQIVQDLFYNKFCDDMRHPHDEIINFVMNVFDYTYCETKLTNFDIQDLYRKALNEIKNKK